MTDADRYRLLAGPYRAPRWRYGRVVMDEARGDVTVVGMTAGRIPWPVGKRGRTKAPILAADLVRAVRTEAAAAVAHGWGLNANTVSVYRRALGVRRTTAGSRRLWRLNYKEVVTPGVFARAVRAANTPAANVRKGATWRGKPLPDHLKKNLDRTGWVPSAETRARISAAQKARGRVRRNRERPWTEEEDALLDRLRPAEVAARTGRTIAGVYLRARRLRRARGEPLRSPGRPWAPRELALLGTMPDDQVAARTGRGVSAVLTKRSNLGIRTFCDRRRRSAPNRRGTAVLNVAA